MKTNDQLGQFTAPGEVRLVRSLPGPIERVWEYLTDPTKRARWFAGGPMEPRAGGPIELFFRHANLSPNEAAPAENSEVQDPGIKMSGTVLRWEPPRLLSYTFAENSQVTFELTPQGDQVLLVLTHRSWGDDLPDLKGYSAGWHTHVALLIAILEGTSLPPFWATHAQLKALYEKHLAAASTNSGRPV